MSKTLFALVLILAAGCRAGEEARSSERTERKEPKPSPERSAPREDRPLAKPGAGEGFTAEERATMEVAWKAFVDDSPNWPLYRDDWVSIGPEATNTLVENLFRAMVLAYLRNFPEGYDRAKKELILMGPASVATCMGILERGTYWDPESKAEKPLPSGLVTNITECLVAIGAPSVTPLIGLLGNDSAAVRRASALALGKIRDPRGLQPIMEVLREADEWADRMIAARAVGSFGTPEATRALVAALSDRDESVVAEVARSLAAMKSEVAVPALEKREKKAREAGEFRVERACRAAVKSIRGER